MEYFINANNLDDKKYITEYVSRYEQLNKMYKKMNTMSNDTLNIGYGDLCSGMIIILYDRSCDSLLDVYKLVLNKYNLNFNDVYITYFKKCSNDSLNLSALKYELDVIGNSCFYLLHGFNFTYKDLKILHVDYNKFINILNKDMDNNDIIKLKYEFLSLIENSIKYTMYKKGCYAK